MNFDKRLTRLEHARRLRRGDGHYVSVIRYPWPMRDDELDAWLAEQCRCDCTPNCRGKRIGVIIPEKAPSPEAWAADVQRYAREKAGRDDA